MKQRVYKQPYFQCSQIVATREIKKIATEIRTELSKFGYTDSEISDILVKLLYHIKPSSHKSVLWFCYGNYIVENINKHIKSGTKVIQCVDCGEWFEVNIKDTETCRCAECVKEHKKALKREQNKRAYEKRKFSMSQSY